MSNESLSNPVSEESVHVSKDVPSGFDITSADAAILQDYLAQFDEATRGAPRARIVDRAMTELAMLRPDTRTFDKVAARKVWHRCFPIFLSYLFVQKIKKWFTNRIIGPRRQYIKFTRKWSARSAYYQMCRDRIIEYAKEESQLMPGHPQFLGALQNATTTLWDAEPPQSKDDYIKAAKDWSNGTPPKDVQSRYVARSPLTYFTSYRYFTGWQQPCESGLSRTFKANYIRHVASAALFLLHTKAKSMT